jgi:serine/threonine-protein kinase
MGTPAFMPPEQARGRWNRVDARADVWAVGATLWTCLTGRFVHRAETGNEVLLMAMTKPAPRFASIAPSAPAALGRLLDRALEYEPEKRFESAAAMQQELREVLGAMAGVTTVKVSVDPGVSDPMAPTVLKDSSPGARSPLAMKSLLGTSASQRLTLTQKPARTTRWMAVGATVAACAALAMAWRATPRDLSAGTSSPRDAGEVRAVIAPPSAPPEPPPSVTPPAPATPAASVPPPAARHERHGARGPAPSAAPKPTAPAPATPASSPPPLDPHDLRQ